MNKLNVEVVDSEGKVIELEDPPAITEGESDDADDNLTVEGDDDHQLLEKTDRAVGQEACEGSESTIGQAPPKPQTRQPQPPTT